MANDVDNDKSIDLTEFLNMMKMNAAVETSDDPGFKLSAGIIATTRQEKALLMRRLGKNTSPLGSPKSNSKVKDAAANAFAASKR